MERNDIPPINLAEVIKNLLSHKKLYYKVLPATLVITYLILCCIPRYYKCTVSLAPESSPTSSMSGSLSSLASSFGLSSLNKMGGNGDALFADIYPNIIASNNFIADLMTVEVTTKDGELTTSYYTYLRDHQKMAWWSFLFNTMLNWINPLPADNHNGSEKINVFNLTKRQANLFLAVQGNIKCSIDKKTDIVSIVVKDQDPLVSAIMADATCKKLQEYIVDYRTNKARIDYEYYQKLTTESKKDYEEALKLYGLFSDAHTDLSLSSYKAKQEDIENDMQQKYNINTTMNAQLQSTAAKLQEATPAFTIIDSASVPVKADGPKRMIISIAMTILAFFVLTAKLIFTKPTSDPAPTTSR